MERLALSDQLLLAQAVHQVGTDPVDWARVSGLLLAHPLVNNAARKQALGGQSLDTLFGADACRDAWTQLMKRHGLAADGEPRQDRGSQLSLARILYADRLVQLREEIGAKEQKFRVLITELQDLRSGKMDEMLKSQAGIASPPPEAPVAKPAAAAEAAGAKEVAPASPAKEGRPSRKRTLSNADDSEAPPAKQAEVPPAVRQLSDDEVEKDLLEVEEDLLGSDKDAAAPGERAPSATHAATATYGGARSRRRGAAANGAEASASPSPASPGPRSTRRAQRGAAAAPSDTPADDAKQEAEEQEEEAAEDEEDGAAEAPTPVSDAERDKNRRRTTQVLQMLLNQVSNHTHGNLFHQAIKEVDAPDYYSMVHEPMDLKTIKLRIKEGSIASPLELRHALTLMFANALMYNRPGTEVHRMANEMRLATEELLNHFDATQAETEAH